MYEYEAKLRKYDVCFYGAAPAVRGASQPPPPGPLVQRFRNYELLRLVAGPWGDLSQDFHLLLKTFADKRVEALARGRGAEMGAGELGMVMGKVRRAMSVQVVRSNARASWRDWPSWGQGGGPRGRDGRWWRGWRREGNNRSRLVGHLSHNSRKKIY